MINKIFSTVSFLLVAFYGCSQKNNEDDELHNPIISDSTPNIKED